MESAIKTVGGVDIAWMGLTFDVVRVLVAWEFDVLRAEEILIRIINHFRIRRGDYCK